MKLYQQLNEVRTQGEWEPVVMRYTSDPKEIITGVGIELRPDYKEVVFDTILPDEDEQYAIEHARIKANAQYTALAVNNLHHLAEALENIATHSEDKEAVRLAKQALSRIS